MDPLNVLRGEVGGMKAWWTRAAVGLLRHFFFRGAADYMFVVYCMELQVVDDSGICLRQGTSRPSAKHKACKPENQRTSCMIGYIFVIQPHDASESESDRSSFYITSQVSGQHGSCRISPWADLLSTPKPTLCQP